LLRDGKRYSDISYQHLQAFGSQTRFVESPGPLPSDGTQVGQTWRYVSVRGGWSVVDPRGARIIGIGERDAGRQSGRDDVTIATQPAVATVVGALGQGFGNPRPARAVLGKRGGSGTSCVLIYPAA
jgi:hypothetical protein